MVCVEARFIASCPRNRCDFYLINGLLQRKTR